jgi:quercetin dioxygenase-like cupin family protein
VERPPRPLFICGCRCSEARSFEPRSNDQILRVEWRAMKTIVSAALLCLLVGVVCAQEKAVPVGEEGHHQLALENEYTRVFRVAIAPKDSTLMHQHDRDYVYVMIGSSQVEVVKPGAAPTQMKLNDGDVKFTKGPLTHKVTNTGDTLFVNLTIEVKKASTKAVCGASWAGQAEKPDTCRLTGFAGGIGQGFDLETDQVLAYIYSVMGSTTGVTAHDADNPRLVVALAPLRCLCGGSQELEMKAGDVTWLPKGILANVSKTGNGSPRFVTVSFKWA